MTEEMFMAWAKTPEGGSKSAKQAENKWLEMADDPSYTKEGEGSEMRIAVKIYTDLVDYDDHARQREIERQSKLSGKLTNDQLEDKARILVMGQEDGGAEEQAARSAALYESAIAADGLVLPELASLSKKRKAAEVGEDATGEEEAEAAKGEKPVEPDRKWFDAASEVAKAKRQFDSQVSKKASSMTQVKNQMRACIDAARATTAGNTGPTPTSFLVELKICNNRLKALETIRDGSHDEFAAYCAALKSEVGGATAPDARSVGSHQTASDRALAQAGPCHNYEDLLTISQVKAMGDEFQDCRVEDDLQGVWKRARAAMAHWDELLAACRTAAGELKKAAEPGGNKKGKAKTKSKPKNKAVKAQNMYHVFSSGFGNGIPVYEVYPVPESHDLSLPFIIKKTALPEFLGRVVLQLRQGEPSPIPVLDEIESFKKLFKESDIRFTAGKAQSAMKDQGELVAKELLSALDGKTFLDGREVQPTSCFGSIEKRRSLQYEIGGSASLRLTVAGCRRLFMMGGRFLSCRVQGFAWFCFTSEFAKGMWQ